MADSVISLDDPVARDPSLAGKKGAALAEMIQAGVPVPAGFVVSTQAFLAVLGSLASGHSFHSLQSSNRGIFQRAGEEVRRAIREANFPEALVSQIRRAYQALGEPAVSARSSSTAEDLENASFAGQYDSFLNIRALDGLIQRVPPTPIISF